MENVKYLIQSDPFSPLQRPILKRLERFERMERLEPVGRIDGLNVLNDLNAQVDQSLVSGTFH